MPVPGSTDTRSVGAGTFRHSNALDLGPDHPRAAGLGRHAEPPRRGRSRSEGRAHKEHTRPLGPDPHCLHLHDDRRHPRIMGELLVVGRAFPQSLRLSPGRGAHRCPVIRGRRGVLPLFQHGSEIGWLDGELHPGVRVESRGPPFKPDYSEARRRVTLRHHAVQILSRGMGVQPKQAHTDRDEQRRSHGNAGVAAAAAGMSDRGLRRGRRGQALDPYFLCPSSCGINETARP